MLFNCILWISYTSSHWVPVTKWCTTSLHRNRTIFFSPGDLFSHFRNEEEHPAQSTRYQGPVRSITDPNYYNIINYTDMRYQLHVAFGKQSLRVFLTFAWMCTVHTFINISSKVELWVSSPHHYSMYVHSVIVRSPNKQIWEQKYFSQWWFESSRKWSQIRIFSTWIFWWSKLLAVFW